MLLSLLPVYCNGLIWSLAPVFGWGSYAPEPFGLSCSLDWGVIPWSYTVGIFSFCYGIPLCLMVFCYGRIICFVRNATSQSQLSNTNKEEYITKVTLSTDITKVKLLKVYSLFNVSGYYVRFF